MKFGIAVHMEHVDPSQPLELVRDQVLEIVQLVDEVGFDVVWAVEHHGHEDMIGPNPLMQLANWAAHTKRVRLGTAVLAVPYWHPVRLAGEIAMADVLTGGRLEVGVARGAFQYEFDRMLGGLPQEQGREYLFETIPAVMALWAGDYEHNGKHWSFPSTTSVPKPLQKPHPPLWVAARDPGTFDWAVKHDMSIMSTPHRLPMSEVENLARTLQTARDNNPDHPRQRWLVSRMTCVYEDPKDWRIPVNAILENTRIFMGLWRKENRIINGYPEPIDLSEEDERGDYRPEALRENMMFGTPDEVVSKLNGYRDLGVDMFLYNANFRLPHDVVMRSLRLFASEVMPKFAGGT